MEFKLLYIYKPPAKLPSLPNKCKLIPSQRESVRKKGWQRRKINSLQIFPYQKYNYLL